MKTNNMIANSAIALAAASAVAAGPVVTVKMTLTTTVCETSTSTADAIGTDVPAMGTPPIFSQPTTTLEGGNTATLVPGEVGSGLTSPTEHLWPTFTPVPVPSFSSSTLITPGGNSTTAFMTSSADAVSGGSASSTAGANNISTTAGAPSSTTGSGAGGTAATSGTATGDAGAVQMQGSVLGLVVFCAIGLFLF